MTLNIISCKVSLLYLWKSPSTFRTILLCAVCRRCWWHLFLCSCILSFRLQIRSWMQLGIAVFMTVQIIIEIPFLLLQSIRIWTVTETAMIVLHFICVPLQVLCFKFLFIVLYKFWNFCNQLVKYFFINAWYITSQVLRIYCLFNYIVFHHNFSLSIVFLWSHYFNISVVFFSEL
jgi:hypothetical protein